MKDDIMTTAEAAEILGIARESVARLIRKGQLEGTRFGRDWMVYRKSVEKYLDQFGGLSKNDPRRGKLD